MSATPGAGGAPLLFVNRGGQPLRFFVDAGGDIDSNTRRTSIRKIQRRGGAIVFSPSEAQIIIVWDETSDGQLYARTWSNEGKIVLTLEWINLCVRSERFIGTSESFGGCRVGITDGEIQPLASERAFDEDEGHLPHRPPVDQPPTLPMDVSAPSTVIPSSAKSKENSIVYPALSPQSQPLTVSSNGLEHIPWLPGSDAHSSPVHNLTPMEHMSSDISNQRPDPIPEADSENTDELRPMSGQLQHSAGKTSTHGAEDSLEELLPDKDEPDEARSIAGAAHLLSTLPQHVLDMLAQTLRLPDTHDSYTKMDAIRRQNSARIESAGIQDHPRLPPVQKSSGTSPAPLIRQASGYMHPQATSTVPDNMGMGSPVVAVYPQAHVSSESTDVPPFDYGQAATFNLNPPQPFAAPVTPSSGPPRTPLKRKQGASLSTSETPARPVKRPRSADSALENTRSHTPMSSIPSTSQCNSTPRFFTLVEDGKKIQAGFWVQPEIKERTKLIRAINRHGGRIAHSMSDCHYVVVRASLSDTGKNKSAELGWKHERTVVKPAWIEACVNARELVPIDDYVMAAPTTPRKRGRSTTTTPRKAKSEREDSATTLAEPPTSPGHSHVPNQTLPHGL